MENSERIFEYNFEKLLVYQEAMTLVQRIYEVTRDFPKEELFGIVSQMRRSALSVPLNIAEGNGRFHTKVYVQFLYQSRGSLYETMTLVKLSVRLNILNSSAGETLLCRCNKVAVLLSKLINSMK